MDNNNKNEILDVLRSATGVIDKVGYYIQGGVTYDFKDITWDAAADGKLTLTSAISFENTTGSNISIIGVALFSSDAQTLTSGTTNQSASVKSSGFTSTIILEPNEILRIENAEYTVS